MIKNLFVRLCRVADDVAGQNKFVLVRHTTLQAGSSTGGRKNKSLKQ
jgi:hypothetical protein